MLNQESFDSVMGAYPKGNTLANNPTPAPVSQKSDQQYAATPSTLPTFSTSGTFTTLPIDVGAQTPPNTPNAPWLFNYPRNTTLAQDPPHGWMQALYKLNGGKMDGTPHSQSPLHPSTHFAARRRVTHCCLCWLCVVVRRLRLVR